MKRVGVVGVRCRDFRESRFNTLNCQMRKWTKQPNVAVLQISQGEPRWQFLRQSHASILSKVCRQIINFQKCRWSEYSDGNGFKAFGQKAENRSSSESQSISLSCNRSALLRTFRSPKNLRKRDLPIYSIRCIRQWYHNSCTLRET